MLCNNCGHDNNEKFICCTVCGTRLVKEEPKEAEIVEEKAVEEINPNDYSLYSEDNKAPTPEKKKYLISEGKIAGFRKWFSIFYSITAIILILYLIYSSCVTILIDTNNALGFNLGMPFIFDIFEYMVKSPSNFVSGGILVFSLGLNLFMQIFALCRVFFKILIKGVIKKGDLGTSMTIVAASTAGYMGLVVTMCNFGNVYGMDFSIRALVAIRVPAVFIIIFFLMNCFMQIMTKKFTVKQFLYKNAFIAMTSIIIGVMMWVLSKRAFLGLTIDTEHVTFESVEYYLYIPIFVLMSHLLKITFKRRISSMNEKDKKHNKPYIFTACLITFLSSLCLLKVIIDIIYLKDPMQSFYFQFFLLSFANLVIVIVWQVLYSKEKKKMKEASAK